jgi:hypothetical protein
MMTDVDAPKRLIKFPCKCGHRFALPLDMAAGVAQCPKCGLLCDVPSLSDLDHIADDGTLMVQPPQKRAEPRRLTELNKFYNPSHLDEMGNERDLRPTFESTEDVGVDLTPIDLKDQGRIAAPKYDPVTGELIRDIEIGPEPTKFATGNDPPPDQIPVAGTASLTYAPAQRTLAALSIRIPLELFMPVNVIVLLIVFVVHVLDQLVIWSIMGGFHFILPVLILLSTLIFAHFGSVIDETGPEEHDEIPRPIRGMSFTDDIWRPFFSVTVALMLCYGPAYVVVGGAADERIALAAGGLLLLVGTFAFPAVLLTTSTSGTLNNLRPDRVMGVMKASGLSYVIAVLLWLATLGGYIFALTGSIFFLVGMGSLADPDGLVAKLMSRGAFVYPVMFLAVLLAHWFCWHMGLIYRYHHDRFPWVLQRHISTRRKTEAERAAASRARRKKPMYVVPKIQSITKPEADEGR